MIQSIDLNTLAIGMGVMIPIMTAGMAYAGSRAAINGKIKLLSSRVDEGNKATSNRLDKIESVTSNTNTIVVENSKEIIRLQGKIQHLESDIEGVKLNCIRTHIKDT